jgi:hypothetical protein
MKIPITLMLHDDGKMDYYNGTLKRRSFQIIKHKTMDGAEAQQRLLRLCLDLQPFTFRCRRYIWIVRLR